MRWTFALIGLFAVLAVAQTAVTGGEASKRVSISKNWADDTMLAMADQLANVHDEDPYCGRKVIDYARSSLAFYDTLLRDPKWDDSETFRAHAQMEASGVDVIDSGCNVGSVLWVNLRVREAARDEALRHMGS